VAEAKRTAEEAPSSVVDDVTGVLYSESITKRVQYIKYDLKNLKSQEVSEVVSSVDPSFLRELRDDIGAAMSAPDDAKATVDEIKEGSEDAQDAASEAQRDAIDSVQSSNADHVLSVSAFSSETVKTAVGCMKYEYEM
jgi:hypothetical protein